MTYFSRTSHSCDSISHFLLRAHRSDGLFWLKEKRCQFSRYEKLKTFCTPYGQLCKNSGPFAICNYLWRNSFHEKRGQPKLTLHQFILFLQELVLANRKMLDATSFLNIFKNFKFFCVNFQTSSSRKLWIYVIIVGIFSDRK